MNQVFVSHSHQDSALATRFARALELRGYRTWYFERDCIPGVSYVRIATEVIHACPAMLVFVSPHSLASREVLIELQLAHRRACAFFPILVNVTQDFLNEAQPEWSAILGLATSVSLDSADFEQVVDRVVQGLIVNQIHPVSETAQRAREQERSRQLDVDSSRKIWASDANQIDIRYLDDVVFRNRVIDDFLKNQNRTFLSASKGLGKTLLLTYKRRLLQAVYGQERSGKDSTAVHFIPEGKPYLDFMGDISGLSDEHKRMLGSLGTAKKCWSFALRVSALSYSPYAVSGEEARDVRRFPLRMQEWLRGYRIEPTLVFKELVSQSVKDVNQLLDGTETFLEQRFRRIHHGLYFFIDKADQAMNNSPRDAWIHVQAGLIEAAWDAMNANSHVKIYASIRQEAFANYESAIKTNLFGAIATISYSRSELRSLLDQLTRCYEGCDSFKEFTLVHSVRNPKSQQTEDAYQYLERHSLNRPRDLVIIASELSQHRDDLGEPTFRRLVDQTSSRTIAANVFEENRVFLESLREHTDRYRFFSHIPRNILSREEVYEVCAAFNGIDAATLKQYGRDSADLFHPFWELYSTGLLGVLEEDPDGEPGELQSFKQPADVVHASPTDLPDSAYYLIHPALDALIRLRRRSLPYQVSNFIVIGHGLPWLPHFGPLARVESLLRQVATPSMQRRVQTVLQRVTMRATGETSHPIRDSEEWRALCEMLEHAGQDDLFLWLEELLASSEAAYE